MNQLPTLLAGPILRRSEKDRVCIWLATDRQLPIQAKIYVSSDDAHRASGEKRDEAGFRLICLGTSAPEGERPETVQLGARLFVTLLSVRPSTGQFPGDTLLFYDVILDNKGLVEQGLADSSHGIVYENMPLPCFFLPSTLSRLLHGSCRKPHGPGDDVFAQADALLAGTVGNLQKRPGALFLTGDQIYADDIAGPLSAHLNALGRTLTGWEEAIPGLSARPSEIPLYGRDRTLASAGVCFTSVHGGNHLLTFGEYAAMYLASWNGELLRDVPPAGDPPAIGEYGEQYEKEKAGLLRFKAGQQKARRVLANTPTYMIFDDHDITDDWNLHRKWYTTIREHACSRRVIANALAAYWAFQGWGNSPEAFSNRFISLITDHVNEKKIDGLKANRFEQRLWDFHRWAYALNTDPPVIVLDCRTQREYDCAVGPPCLIDRYGIDWLRTAWTDMGAPREKDLILVTSTPVYGFEPVERFKKILTSFGVRPNKVDRESWIANREGFGILMRTLNNEIRPRSCLVLSGDVHYAFSNRAEFYCDGRLLVARQLTSSAIKNEPKMSWFLKWLSKHTHRTERRFGWKSRTWGPQRLLKPVIDFLVRWNLYRGKNSKFIWRDTVTGICPQGSSALVYPNNNMGLVSLNRDGSAEHRLLTEFPGQEQVFLVR